MKKKTTFHRLKELSELINCTELIARERERDVVVMATGKAPLSA